MTLYAIGDVQGCLDELERLLDQLAFDPDKDRLWFTGDLVNRGPRSLETLRRVRGLGEAAITVLGNHDLHLLAVACGVRQLKARDTLMPVLQAPDRDELLDWLRTRPLAHRAGNHLMVHAGLTPQWTVDQVLERAAEAESWLRGAHYPELFKHLYGDTPEQWSERLEGWPRLRFIVSCLTRIRYCDRQARLDFKCKRSPGQQPAHLIPWFELEDRKTRPLEIIFGHWATLGAWRGQGVTCLDSGCLWGGSLSALNLDDGITWTRVACRGYQ
ncbi:symmetrical bis(5'-nucleosyl)-tetraphosphatase [Candidatus Woesearchaeota archaeon]|nr:symmetrical bis(5'-nucleosyl)-tetraphosphatase [Candidatus Woesearchaeota archaeon]